MEPKPPSPNSGPDMTNFEGWPESWGASADEPQPATSPTTVWIMNTSRPISLRVRGIVTNSSGRRIDVDAPSRDDIAYLAAALAPSPEMAPAQPAPTDVVQVHSVASASVPAAACTTPSLKCPNMKDREGDTSMSYEHYDCKVCGGHIALDYDEMR